MQVYKSNTEHYEALNQLIDAGPDKVLISSFGIYAGLQANGMDVHPKEESQIRKILEKLRPINTYLLVGIPDYRSCRGFTKCMHCERKFVKGILRTYELSTLYPKFSWKISRAHHSKAFISIKNGLIQAVVGGRNLTDSDWNDMSLLVSGDEILPIFIKQWAAADSLTPELVSQIFENNEISENILEYI